MSRGGGKNSWVDGVGVNLDVESGNLSFGSAVVLNNAIDGLRHKFQHQIQIDLFRLLTQTSQCGCHRKAAAIADFCWARLGEQHTHSRAAMRGRHTFSPLE